MLSIGLGYGYINGKDFLFKEASTDRKFRSCLVRFGNTRTRPTERRWVCLKDRLKLNSTPQIRFGSLTPRRALQKESAVAKNPNPCLASTIANSTLLQPPSEPSYARRPLYSLLR